MSRKSYRLSNREPGYWPVRKGKQIHIEFQTHDVHIDDQVVRAISSSFWRAPM
jgi:hypothetical protein